MLCRARKNSRVQLFTDHAQKFADGDRLFRKTGIDILNTFFEFLVRLVGQEDIIDSVNLLPPKFQTVALCFAVVLVAADILA